MFYNLLFACWMYAVAYSSLDLIEAIQTVDAPRGLVAFVALVACAFSHWLIQKEKRKERARRLISPK